jgi:hypothetical protein
MNDLILLRVRGVGRSPLVRSRESIYALFGSAVRCARCFDFRKEGELGDIPKGDIQQMFQGVS